VVSLDAEEDEEVVFLAMQRAQHEVRLDPAKAKTTP